MAENRPPPGQSVLWGLAHIVDGLCLVFTLGRYDPTLTTKVAVRNVKRRLGLQ